MHKIDHAHGDRFHRGTAPWLWAGLFGLGFWLAPALPRAQAGHETEGPRPAPGLARVSGVYPHLAYWNPNGECGAGAVVPWAGKLWLISYGPHFPRGSADKLYAITPELAVEAFEGSVGGTPANRMIHRETNQLLIGPYVIDAAGAVRVIPPDVMPGRLTGNARHLFEPGRKVYYATMEEGVYEVDLETLKVNELFADDQGQVGASRQSAVKPAGPRLASLPGYHGKGLYSGQGRLIYANNGEASPEARQRPDVPSGCLAEWDGKSKTWRVVRRNQFTDVRGPGGIHGNASPETGPVWAIGWDHRSLILMLLDQGRWHAYRLPKASHTYDGAHGWNTEWPRFNDIGEADLVLNMHGMFWRFPRSFRAENSAGIEPRSTYLKVLGDYCRWGDQLVFGCDDTAKSEFLNTSRAKGAQAGPGQSHSNLWFASPRILDQLGPPLGRGAVWVNEPVRKDTPSEPYLFAGFERRMVFLAHRSSEPVTFNLEVDRKGTGVWEPLCQVPVPARSASWRALDAGERGVWLRVVADRDCEGVTAQFSYSNPDRRPIEANAIFDGLAGPSARRVLGGILRVRGEDLRTLALAAWSAADGERSPVRFHELNGELKLTPRDDLEATRYTLRNHAIPEDILRVDAASAIYTDDDGKRWRLPKGDPAFDRPGPLGPERVAREVVTERDLFNCHGTFYELPARNAGGIAKVRPICTHNRRIHDYCSYRGLLILSGVDPEVPAGNEHIIRSDDGQAALWAGVVDDLWRMGKPRGQGGPWKDTPVTAGEPSDPFLMTGYDRKGLTLAHQSKGPVTIEAQVDITGDGSWVRYDAFVVPPGRSLDHAFPDAFGAYWIRFVASENTTATAVLTYE